MKIKALIALLLMGSMSMMAQKSYQLQSPDGKLHVTATVGNDIQFSFTHEGTEVLAPSTISMTLQDGTVLGENPKVSKVLKASVDKVIPSPFYKKSEVSDIYNEMTISFRGNYGLVFRLYNEGLAYRFFTKMKNDIIIADEKAEYNFSTDHKTYAPYVNSKKATFEEQYMNSFEQLYVHEAITKLNDKRLMILPFLVELDGGKKLCITESDLENYPGMFLNNTTDRPSLKAVHAPYPKVTKQGGHNQLQMLVQERENFIAKTKGTRSYPWRVFVVSANDKELADNDMVYCLASPSRVSDISWIKPGKVAWDWWNDWNIYDVDFRAGINNDTYKYYIDFASEHGIEYVILDEGWAVNLKADLMQVIPEINVKELVDYGKSKNVSIILWAGYHAFDRDMENVVKYYSEMGVKGFKIDFMDRDDQEIIDFLFRAGETCAKYKMLADFHGICKPAGLTRTYPNVINFEGVHGLENMKWATAESDMVTYDVTIPFIRQVAGPMDYTQGAMRNAARNNYRPVNSEPMSQGTRCRQLATYVIFESPLNMLCDNPSNYMREKECTEFIAGIPTVWDKTVALDGKVAEYVAIARQHGDVWYLGALTNWTPREIELDLSFLGDGNYKIELFKDGINADRAARDYKKETLPVPADRKLKIKMASGGGYAAKIYK
ncbi:glycoside hydrolase family 97 protein [Parabacteroides sp. AM08-6]|uniref:glycoside hydrolase family 97 protein n=1 Tax=Parabacteroides sp. AM08-6 TaxID=2292053 RepID=UPI000EFF9058|nr:glycoside hydrolase family 97 protein [Parabacteroides sp. AM08-6]RHJ83180.1 glycoside hydrolase family 97 protein [Parabacteroides sp. AM08-6]